MAKGKKTIQIYADWKNQVNLMPDDIAGKLFKQILNYCNVDGVEYPDPEDVMLNIIWQGYKTILKRDYKKYESLIKRRSDAGKKGMKSRWEDNTVITKDNTVIKNITKITDKDKDKDKDKEINNIDKSISVDWDVLKEMFIYITGKQIRLINSKTKQQIKARLKEGYTKDDFKKALVNCYNDPYHMETNHKHLTLEFIARADKLEKYSTLKSCN